MNKILFGVLTISCIIASVALAVPPSSDGRIQPSPAHPRYWEFHGKPVMLLGASVEDNLFQIPDIETHLDLLQSADGNYVRNTMSWSDEGNVIPYRKLDNGLFDLEQWNEEFWTRFETLLRETAERDIIVQIEVWATFTYYRDLWATKNPFNPQLNINYTAAESGLSESADCHPGQTCNPFFRSPPTAEDLPLVRKYQERFVRKILAHTFQYSHVLYCMDNETSVTPAWGAYWAQFILDAAEEAGVQVETTEMWDAWDLAHAQHANTWKHPELYSFIEVSQNNHQTGDAHYNNALAHRQRTSIPPRPLNNVKIYGAKKKRFGSDCDAVERFWRNLFGGHASVRFHRPAGGCGLGLNESAQENIKSARMFVDTFDIFAAEPAPKRLENRSENGSFCLAAGEKEFAVYFPHAGAVTLVLGQSTQSVTLQWLHTSKGVWSEPKPHDVSGRIHLKTPKEGSWVVRVNTN